MAQSVLVRDNEYPLHSTIRGPEDMDTLSVLKDEHSTLLRELCQMDGQLTSLESSGPNKAARVLKEIGETGRRIREDLQQHTDKEEKGLFPILEARLGKDREIVLVMKREHEELVESVESLRTELDRMIREHDTRRTWNLASKLQELRGGLSDHMSREERILFWLAELRLSRLDQQKVASHLQEIAPTPQYMPT